MSEAEKYLQMVYKDRLGEEWKRLSELDSELRRAVQDHLDSLPPHLWSPMASPADHFFVRDDERMPMSVFERMAMGR